MQASAIVAHVCSSVVNPLLRRVTLREGASPPSETCVHTCSGMVWTGLCWDWREAVV